MYIRGEWAKQECLPQNTTHILCRTWLGLRALPGPRDCPWPFGCGRLQAPEPQGIPFFVFYARSRTRKRGENQGALCMYLATRWAQQECLPQTPIYSAQNVARSEGAARAPATRPWPSVAWCSQHRLQAQEPKGIPFFCFCVYCFYYAPGTANCFPTVEN